MKKLLTQTDDPIGRFLDVAHQSPDNPAVDLGETIVTYAQLERKARRFAARFARAETPRVFIALPQGPEAYAAMIGALLSGGCYVPANIATPPRKLAKLLDTIKPNFVVAEPASAEVFADLTPQASIIDPACIENFGLFKGRGTRNSIAYLIMTSGSTGSPKGVVISMAALAHYVNWLSSANLFLPQDRVSQFPNISFDLSVLDIFGALNAGATLAPPQSNSDRLFPAAFARRLRISVWVSVPSFIDLAVRARQATPTLLETVRLFLFCGEPLRRAHLRTIFEARPDVAVMNLYGPTEATVSMTCLHLRANTYENSCEDAAALGKPIPGMGLHLVGGADANEGEIVLTGPQLATEYWQDPERSAKSFHHFSLDGRSTRGYFTGDWGARRRGHIFFTGRIDNQVKINGFRIETGEVVARLAECGWPIACVLKYDNRLIAVVEVADGMAFELGALRSELFASLEPHAVPARIYVIGRMPTTINGKLDELAVRSWLENGPEPADNRL